MDFELYTITELKKFLVKNNLSPRGKKQELINRLNTIYGTKEEQELISKFNSLFDELTEEETIDVVIEFYNDDKHSLTLYYDDCIIDVKEIIGNIYGIDLTNAPLYSNFSIVDNNCTMLDIQAKYNPILTFKKN